MLLVLQSLLSDVKNMHVPLLIDNATAVSYIRSQGGTHSLICNAIALEIWAWAISRNIYLSAAHIPGVLNVEADRASRSFRDEMEFKLNVDRFREIMTFFNFKPNVDLFASRLNYQLKPYASFQPDPECSWVNSLYMPDWGRYKFYAFPPFSIIPKVLQKIRNDKAVGVLIIPHWPTQSFWPIVLELSVKRPFYIPRETTCYSFQQTRQGDTHFKRNFS